MKEELTSAKSPIAVRTLTTTPGLGSCSFSLGTSTFRMGSMYGRIRRGAFTTKWSSMRALCSLLRPIPLCSSSVRNCNSLWWMPFRNTWPHCTLKLLYSYGYIIHYVQISDQRLLKWQCNKKKYRLIQEIKIIVKINYSYDNNDLTNVYTTFLNIFILVEDKIVLTFLIGAFS